jgi:hypothetical protein
VSAILAQVVRAGGIPELAVWLILVAAIVAVVLIVLRAMGIAVPGWVVQILWVIAIAAVGILAIRLLLSL